MKKPIYHFSNSMSNKKLRDVFLNDSDLVGELIDAAICNGIASELYNLRKTTGITQKRLAEVLDIKQSNISRWETPGYQGYKVKVLSKIVRTLGGRLSIKIHPLTTHSYHLSFDAPLAIRNNHFTFDTKSRGNTRKPDEHKQYNYDQKGYVRVYN